jgi:hypothetical protein
LGARTCRLGAAYEWAVGAFPFIEIDEQDVLTAYYYRVRLFKCATGTAHLACDAHLALHRAGSVCDVSFSESDRNKRPGTASVSPEASA